ncbi:alpha/beta fold hydrolase [Sphingomonas naphthae]|uniref:Alpha/beta fold hydrolase n=1 Tax=Sphingomonas naphthae TaxID=1813468 RepID=A0ABY7TGE3_9SPHN|nr:alpha/beta fold hydrolase [Sphingomonas naphthae]WCT72133.1 alpha/beta fold hydrolase [Sphingomonas naphthae]
MLRSETDGDPARRAKALKGLAAYQQAGRPEKQDPAPVIAQVGRARIRDYGGEGRPVLFVPSLINPPSVLDLSLHNSLLRWLATQGLRPMLVDWGEPLPEERDLSLAGHVEHLLLPLIDALPEPPVLAGYCVGGTMAVAAAARRALPGLVLIAAPWCFSGFPDVSRIGLTDLANAAEDGAQQLGLFPIEVLQTGFWKLDPARTVGKFERFAGLDPASEAAADFVQLEDWASDGPPLTLAAGFELIDALFGDDLSGKGEWHVAGAPVKLADIDCPVLNILSTTDRIVPATSAAPIGERLVLGLGHVGMIVGGRGRRALWEPLAEWLARLPSDR